MSGQSGAKSTSLGDGEGGWIAASVAHNVTDVDPDRVGGDGAVMVDDHAEQRRDATAGDNGMGQEVERSQ